MRLIVKRTVYLFIAALFLLPSFGAKPQLVSEEEAKEAGLAFINRMFDVNETEAKVAFVTQAGYSFIDGETIETGKEEPVYIYSVSISESDNGLYRYYAYINAETGVAYYAARGYSLGAEMTTEQRNAMEEEKGDDFWESCNYSRISVNCKDAAREWISQKFDLNAKILGFIDCGFLADETGVTANFYVVIRDGTIYYINMAWPQLIVLEVGILNQIGPYWSEL